MTVENLSNLSLEKLRLFNHDWFKMEVFSSIFSSNNIASLQIFNRYEFKKKKAYTVIKTFDIKS